MSCASIGARRHGDFAPCRPDPCGTPDDKLISIFWNGPFVERTLYDRGLTRGNWQQRREQLQRLSDAVNAKIPAGAHTMSPDKFYQWFAQKLLPGKHVPLAMKQVLFDEGFRF